MWDERARRRQRVLARRDALGDESLGAQVEDEELLEIDVVFDDQDANPVHAVSLPPATCHDAARHAGNIPEAPGNNS